MIIRGCRSAALLSSLALIACGKSTGESTGSGASGSGSGSAPHQSGSGDVGSNKPVGSGGSTFAHTLADYLAKKTPGVPCPVVAAGQELKIADWTIKVDSVTVNEAESKLPWIRNVDERTIFSNKDRTGLVVQYSVRNDTPVKKPRDLWIEIHTSDGDVPQGAPYNEQLYAKAHGIPTTHGPMSPNTFERYLDIRAAKVGATDNGALWVRHSVTQIDPNDRSGRHTIDVIKAQGVIDLGKATAGPPINPKR